MIQNNTTNNDLLRFTSNIISSYVTKHEVSSQNIPTLINNVFESLKDIRDCNSITFIHTQQPAMNIEESVTDDYIFCLEDGKKFKMMKRHLRATYNMTPSEYREKWYLPPTYPMVAPNYAKIRSKLAVKSALGKGENHHRRKKSLNKKI